MNGLSGTFRHVTTWDIGGPFALAGEFVRAVHQPLLPLDAVAGLWRGQYTVRECSATEPYCSPLQIGDVDGVELLLTQSGSDVSGTLTLGRTRIPIEGRISDGHLILRGSGVESQGQVSFEIRLTEWNVNVDQIGRVNGTFGYTFESRSPTWRSGYRSTVRGELRYVVLAPGL